MSKEEELERVLKATPLSVGAGTAELDGVNAKCLGVFAEILKVRRSLIELDVSSLDMVECICRLATLRGGDSGGMELDGNYRLVT